VFLAVIEHKATQVINTFNKLSNPNMQPSNNQAKAPQPQPGLLTFEDFEDNEEYDKILTAEELRKKAADFISVSTALFRNNRTKNRRRRNSVQRKSDIIHTIVLATTFYPSQHK
jgi:hypothetical protein